MTDVTKKMFIDTFKSYEEMKREENKEEKKETKLSRTSRNEPNLRLGSNQASLKTLPVIGTIKPIIEEKAPFKAIEKKNVEDRRKGN